MPDLPEIVTIAGQGCSCETPSLTPGQTMTTQLTDYVHHLINTGCVAVVKHPPKVQAIIDAGNAIDATPKAQP